MRRRLAAQYPKGNEFSGGEIELLEETLHFLGVPQRRVVEPQHHLFGGRIAFRPIILEEVQQLFRRAARRHVEPATRRSLLERLARLLAPAETVRRTHETAHAQTMVV